MATISHNPDSLHVSLIHFLSRWSLVTALLILTCNAFYAAAGSAAADTTLGQGYGGLRQAIHSPVLFRLAWLSESLSWLMVGGTLITFAGLFARRAPLRAACIATCGIGQLITTLGAFSQSSISSLATRYVAAAPNQQAALVQSFLDLQGLIHSAYDIGILLEGAGFLLVAWAAWEWRGFPHWLTLWLAVPGLLGLVFFILNAADAPSAFVFPLAILESIALIGAYAAVAVTCWRPSATLAAGAPSTVATV